MKSSLKNGITKAAVVAISGATAFTGLVAVASPAGATGSGSCVTGDLCLFYRVSYGGAKYGHWDKINHQGRYFGGNSDGNGQPVRNDAASAANFDNVCAFRVFVYPHGTSPNPSQYFAAGAHGNLNGTLNNNNAAQDYFC